MKTGKYIVYSPEANLYIADMSKSFGLLETSDIECAYHWSTFTAAFDVATSTTLYYKNKYVFNVYEVETLTYLGKKVG